MKKNHVILGLVVLAAVAALVIWGHNRIHFDFGVFRSQLAMADWGKIGIATGCIYLGYIFRSIRWALLIRHSKKVSPLALLGTQVMGFTAVALIGRVADPVRPYLVSKKTALPLSSQIAVYIVERMFDLGSMALIFSVVLLTAHEALHLGYESAQTRRVPRRPGYFNLTTHFPWVGLRTNDPRGAHVEFLRGIENPIGIKVGKESGREHVARWLEALDPQREPGRLTLIHRFGAGKIADALPKLIEAVRAEGGQVVWICDPMHGNTHTTAGGVKTRNFEDIHAEVEQAFDIHRAMGHALGGVHIEVTGENVTECIGGSHGPREADLARAYESEVDPRLNYDQALELAFLIAQKMKSGGQ